MPIETFHENLQSENVLENKSSKTCHSMFLLIAF